MKSVLTRYPALASISILILLSILVWLPRLQGPLDLRYDAGVYYILGTSLAEGKGYRLLNEPGEIQAIQYPPLLPLFAAAHQFVAGTNNPMVAGHWLRFSFMVMFMAFILTVYALARQYLSPCFAFLVALLTLLHIQMTWFSELFFAELPVALTGMLFLTVTGVWKGRGREWMVGILGAVTYLLRSASVALLAAWVAESVFKGRFKQMAFRLVLALVPVILWQGYIQYVKAGEEFSQPVYEYQRAGYQYYNVGYLDNLAYIDPFVPERGTVSPELLFERILGNLVGIPAKWGEAIGPNRESSRTQLERINREFLPVEAPLWVVEFALTLLGVLVLSGLVVLTIKGKYLIPLYIVGSSVLICLTPWPGQFARYLVPLAPLLFLALFVLLEAAWEGLSTRFSGVARSGGLTVIVVLVGGLIAQEAVTMVKVYSDQFKQGQIFYKDDQGRQQEYHLFFYTPEWGLHDKALEWLNTQGQPGEIIATSTPQWVYLKTGLKAVMPPFEPDVHEAQRLMDSVPVNYLVVDSLEFVDLSRRYGAPVVHAFPREWELVYSQSNEGSQIYRRVNAGSAANFRTTESLSSVLRAGGKVSPEGKGHETNQSPERSQGV